jgi:hypothetical protein
MQPSVEDLHPDDSWMAVVVNLVWIEPVKDNNPSKTIQISIDFLLLCSHKLATFSDRKINGTDGVRHLIVP